MLNTTSPSSSPHFTDKEPDRQSWEATCPGNRAWWSDQVGTEVRIRSTFHLYYAASYNLEDRKYIMYFRISPIQNSVFFKIDKPSGVRETCLSTKSQLKWALHMTSPILSLSVLSSNLRNSSNPSLLSLNPQRKSQPTAFNRKQKL